MCGAVHRPSSLAVRITDGTGSDTAALVAQAVGAGSVALPWLLQLELCAIDPQHTALTDIETWAVWERNDDAGKKAITEVAVENLADRGLILPVPRPGDERPVAPELAIVLAARRRPVFSVTFSNDGTDHLADIPRLYGVHDDPTGITLALFELVSGPVLGPPGRTVRYSLCDLTHAASLIVAWLQESPTPRRRGASTRSVIITGSADRQPTVLRLEVHRRSRSVSLLDPTAPEARFDDITEDATALHAAVQRLLVDRS